MNSGNKKDTILAPTIHLQAVRTPRLRIILPKTKPKHRLGKKLDLSPLNTLPDVIARTIPTITMQIKMVKLLMVFAFRHRHHELMAKKVG